MKKLNILQSLLLSFLSVGLWACFDDQSSLGTAGAVTEIVIADLPDTAVISYNGVVLDVTPDMQGTTYPEDELEYAWYMYDSRDADFGADGFEEGYRAHRVGDGKTLSYEVNLPSGDYYFIFEAVAKTTGYSQAKRMKVSVSTDFSRGFFILKETAEGMTELDMYTGQKGVTSDLMQKRLGASLEGMPLNLAVVYSQAYINDDNQTMERTNMVHIFTESTYRGFRTEDMAPTFDRATLRFDGLDRDETALNMGNGMFVAFFLSNKGVYSIGNNAANSGKFGFPVGTGASRFMLPYGMNMVYWDDTEHHIYIVDYNGRAASPASYPLNGVNEENLTCIAAGQHNTTVSMIGKHWFLCEDKTDHSRWLYQVGGMAMQAPSISVSRLDPSLHVSKAASVVGNALQATILYALHEGKLYTYNWVSGAESGPISLPGITNDETLTYVSNQYLNTGSDKFDYLVVATQKGNEYKIYFYDELVGGVPISPTEKMATGMGKVKCVRYVTSQLNLMTLGIQPIPRLPWCD